MLKCHLEFENIRKIIIIIENIFIFDQKTTDLKKFR